MSSIVAAPSGSLEKKLSDLPKGELVKKLASMKTLANKHRVKERAVHGGKVILGATLSAVGGGVAGLVTAKLPFIPKTRIRTDLAGGAILSALCAANFFGNGATSATSHYINDLAKGMIGAGTSEYVKSFLVARGVKVAAI